MYNSSAARLLSIIGWLPWLTLVSSAIFIGHLSSAGVIAIAAFGWSSFALAAVLWVLWAIGVAIQGAPWTDAINALAGSALTAAAAGLVLFLGWLMWKPEPDQHGVPEAPASEELTADQIRAAHEDYIKAKKAGRATESFPDWYKGTRDICE